MKRESSGVRWYRRLLALLPFDFRADYASEMEGVFNEQYRDTRGEGRVAIWKLWWSTLTGILTTAPREHLDMLRQDCGFAVRMMSRNLGFTMVAVLTLALGIGANTAIFSAVQGLLVQPLPFREPERLAAVWEHNRPRARPENVVGPANYLSWLERNSVFESMAAMTWASLNLTGEGEPERLAASVVSWDFFRILGQEAATGRTFVETDARPGDASDIVVLSHGLWQRRFGGDPDIVGRTLQVNQQPATVVGVMPAGTDFPPNADLWTPLVFTERHRTHRGRYLSVIARLREGVTLKQAQAEMDVIAAQLEKENPDFNTGWGANVKSLHEEIAGEYRRSLLVLLAAVGMVLLIACVNVASLMLSRGAVRQRELAVRTALGALRARLVRQLLTESLVLALIGGALGLLLARVLLAGLLLLLPDVPGFISIGLNAPVFFFAVSVSLLTGIIFGLVPAFQSAARDMQEPLKQGGRSAGEGRRRVHNTLVVAEIALALILLVGAGLFVRSLLSLYSVDPGFRTRDLLTFRVSLPRGSYGEDAQRVDFFDRALLRIESLPGVESAGAVSFRPLTLGAATSFILKDRPVPPDGEHPVANVRVVQGDYFRTMGIPLLRGRSFDSRDHAGAPRVVLINQTLAERFWPGQNPVGKKVSMSWGEAIDAEIVGVVGDVLHQSLSGTSRETLYWANSQLTYGGMVVMVRSQSDPARLAGAIRSEIQSLDPDLPIYGVRPMEELVSESVEGSRLMMVVLVVFALAALLLAALGIYGLLSYSVSRRTHEIGVRMALGAETGATLMWVLAQGMLPSLIGTGVGLGGAVMASQYLESLLFAVAPIDAVTYLTVSAALVAVALTACLVPARRATRVDPMAALRCE